MRAIGALEATVKVGFDGVHRRQDQANHRTEKAEDRISVLESTDNQQKGSWKATTAIAGVASVLGGWVVSMFK